jgi:hypothetical protein
MLIGQTITVIGGGIGGLGRGAGRGAGGRAGHGARTGPRDRRGRRRHPDQPQWLGCPQGAGPRRGRGRRRPPPHRRAAARFPPRGGVFTMPLTRADRPFYAVHRADLVDILARACAEAGVDHPPRHAGRGCAVEGTETLLTLRRGPPERHGLTFAADGSTRPRAPPSTPGPAPSSPARSPGAPRSPMTVPCRRRRMSSWAPAATWCATRSAGPSDQHRRGGGTRRLGRRGLAPYRRPGQPAPRLHGFLPRGPDPPRPGRDGASLGPLPPPRRAGLDRWPACASRRRGASRRCPSSRRAPTWRWRMPGASSRRSPPIPTRRRAQDLCRAAPPAHRPDRAGGGRQRHQLPLAPGSMAPRRPWRAAPRGPIRAPRRHRALRMAPWPRRHARRLTHRLGSPSSFRKYRSGEREGAKRPSPGSAPKATIQNDKVASAPEATIQKRIGAPGAAKSLSRIGRQPVERVLQRLPPARGDHLEKRVVPLDPADAPWRKLSVSYICISSGKPTERLAFSVESKLSIRSFTASSKLMSAS